MHLPELPTIFVKGDEERKVYFTVQARELLAAGWSEKGAVIEKAPKKEAKKEVVEEPKQGVEPEIKEEAKPVLKTKAAKAKAEVEVQE